MSSLYTRLPTTIQAHAREAPMPGAFDPMLATLTDTAFSNDDWVFERKLDGIRLLIFRDHDDVRLITRNGKCRARHFPELTEAFRAQPCKRFVVDGEVVAFEGKVTSFARLQNRAGLADPGEARASGIQVYFYVFDTPWVAGLDVTRAPLRLRKQVVRAVLDFSGALRYTPHRNAVDERYFQQACAKRWEGVIAKRADSDYRNGRSKNWLKLKCEQG